MPVDLEPAIAALADEQALSVARITEISTNRTAKSVRATYRLDCLDGRIVKARFFSDPGAARRLGSLAGLMDSRSFAAVIAVNDRAVLEQWVEGTVIGAEAVTADTLAGCGGILGSLHTKPFASREDSGPSPVDGHVAALCASAAVLVDGGHLEDERAGAAISLALEHAPAAVAVGITHNDLCPGNIVRRTNGGLCIIDNELLSLDAVDSDLGRTWYRWPMEASQWRVFAGAYMEHAGVPGFVAHFPFWAVYTLVNAAAFHAAIGSARGAQPLRRLDRLLSNLEHEWDAVEVRGGSGT